MNLKDYKPFLPVLTHLKPKDRRVQHLGDLWTRGYAATNSAWILAQFCFSFAMFSRHNREVFKVIFC